MKPSGNPCWRDLACEQEIPAPDAPFHDDQGSSGMDRPAGKILGLVGRCARTHDTEGNRSRAARNSADGKTRAGAPCREREHEEICATLGEHSENQAAVVLLEPRTRFTKGRPQIENRLRAKPGTELQDLGDDIPAPDASEMERHRTSNQNTEKEKQVYSDPDAQRKNHETHTTQVRSKNDFFIEI